MSAIVRRIGTCFLPVVFLLFYTGQARCADETGQAAAKNTGQDIFPTNVHRVLFLGDSITYAGMYVEYVEAWYRAHSSRAVDFIDAGVSSETVSGLSEADQATLYHFSRPDLHERLARTLDLTHPDFVFVCYGMNDGIYLPLDEERFKKFREGMIWTHGELAKRGLKTMHITPPVFDEVKGGHPGYGEVLDTYSTWLINQKTNGWEVIDVHFPMRQALADNRRKDPNFAFTKDGIHPGEAGHWLMAREILMHLGAMDVADKTNAISGINGGTSGDRLLYLVHKEQGAMKDAWQTAIKPLRPFKKGLPLDQAEAKAAELEKQMHELYP